MRKKEKRIAVVKLLIIGLLGILAVIIPNIKSMDEISFTDFVLVFVLLLIFGTKEFQVYYDYKTSIRKGIDLINDNLIWSIDNLIVYSDPQDASQLIVRNDLLWIGKGKNQNESADGLLIMLISDFEYLTRNRKLKDFLKNKSVEFNLYSSDLKNEELLKTKLKNYGSLQPA